jgi:repressor LexA
MYKKRSPRMPLTEAQHELLQFIAATVREKGYPPTHLEMCERFEWRSPNAAGHHVRVLERKGYIERGPRGSSRTIRVLGRVPAFAREGSA